MEVSMEVRMRADARRQSNSSAGDSKLSCARARSHGRHPKRKHGTETTMRSAPVRAQEECVWRYITPLALDC